jgi:threonine dehydrogenase-like Zn-dependent dehydrogenase
MNMKAIVLNKPKDFSIHELETPKPKADEVLIKIKAAAICTNDVRDFNGDCSYSFPRIGGHEYCGVIEELGAQVNQTRFAVGQKVVPYIIDDCKECYYCKSGHENICEGLPHTKTFQNPNGISGYGGFAEYVIAKAEDVFVYDDATPFESMVFTEPFACVLNSINRTNIEFGDDVLVIGGGAMGLMHVVAAKLRGARVILSEPLKERREKAVSLGCDLTIDPINEDAVAKVHQYTNGRGANVIFNTTALPAVAKQAVEMTAPAGTVVMFSSIHPNTPVDVDMGSIHSFQKTITGAVSPPIKAYHQSKLMIEKGLIDPSVFIEKTFH